VVEHILEDEKRQFHTHFVALLAVGIVQFLQGL
jgi:hypothetical protein